MMSLKNLAKWILKSTDVPSSDDYKSGEISSVRFVELGSSTVELLRRKNSEALKIYLASNKEPKEKE
jgi:hypothetical protein